MGRAGFNGFDLEPRCYLYRAAKAAGCEPDRAYPGLHTRLQVLGGAVAAAYIA